MAAKSVTVAGLDLGSAATRCVICSVQEMAISLRGVASVPAQGWAKGRVSDRDGLAESIRAAVRQAERQAGVSVESVVVGLGGTSIDGQDSRGLYEFGRPREIGPDELAYAMERAMQVPLASDRMLLQVFPQDFTVDGRAHYRNPRGTTCSRLEANVHLVTTSEHEHQTLLSAVHHAHLAVEETVFEPIAAAYACVDQTDRGRGVAIIDIGKDSTDLVVYDGDALLLAASLPVSADHFTRDMVIGLNVPYEDAERLKQEYGCALLGLTADNSLIELPTEEGRPSREARRRDLNEILEARAEELFWYVRRQLHRIQMEQALMEGLVLTGGGSQLLGMCDMAERVLNCPARKGLADGIHQWPDDLLTPDWTTAAGLVMYAGRLKVRPESRRRLGALRGLVGKR